MYKVEDASSRQVKRHRADHGLPTGSLHTKVNGFASINGVFQENVEHNSEVLRNLLNLNRGSPAKSFSLCSDTESQDSLTQDRLTENRRGLLDLEEQIAKSADTELGGNWQARKLECAKVPSESGDSTAMPTAETAMWEECNGSTSPMQETDSLKAKRARVENIITSMRHSPPAVGGQEPLGLEDSLRKPKRKQYQPQPQRWDSEDEDSPGKPSRKQEKTKLKGILSHLQTQLDTLQEKYLNMFDTEDDGNLSDNSDDMDDLNEPVDTGSSAIPKYEVNGVSGNSSPVRHGNDRKRRADGSCVLDRTTSYIVRQTLKEELPPLLLNAVDSVMNKLTKSTSSKNTSNNNSTHTKTEISSNQGRNPVLARNAASPPAPAQERKPTPPPPTLLHPSFFMRPFPTPLEQTEAMSLVVPSRKRVRSNDRPLHASSGFHPGDLPMKPEPLLPVSLPTSVAIPNPSLHPTLAASFMAPTMATDPREHFESLRYMYAGSPLIPNSHLSPLNYLSDHRSSPGDLSHLSGESPAYPMIKPEGRDTSPLHMHDRPSSADLSDYSPVNGTSITCTLTPTHLRKAKLMFFFVRYPSSALLRQHFPDVKFNRHNTSQIIKWFSNFREFYYIQMEKFARQAVSDSVESAEDLKVTRDSELYRALNLHYNKSNEFTVPEGFLHVSTTTLREFFTAIKSGKDTEPSWKKTIYKVISKLDEPLPPFFKNPNCLDLLPL
ncbi:prospero homeobox protein 1-like isoform X1 [Lytechinus variegatus]|uniref:prospero homeobox protein 1-like isoform X1 n=1 Tax=Lytechinus variegatus TaxID=7654 RepID=UPI001BB1546C|nr:prospero homeobox protein 1-like isoform X1 [Lytechinus variegatus]XP_041467974.1 prospero homeobox protein 1-like isoform X1 [Lytechinus variegatus]XP_041467975.1 prospero homeobox protein 1-like isoform X1 [Lytechinus variegatus]XP_041467976.1 prospero homeobox protein 1-like isoform X1 [Lytechinus variegatus]